MLGKHIWNYTALCLVILILSGCGGSKTEQLAKVEDWVLTTEEFREMVVNRWSNEQAAVKVSKQELTDFLDMIVNNRLKVVDGYSKGLDKNPEVKQKYDESIISAAKLIFNNDIKDKIEVSEKELREFFEHDRLDIVASHVLVKTGEERSDDEARKIAESFRAKALKDDSQLEQMLKKYSEDPTIVTAIARNVPWSGRNSPFEVTAYNMEPSKISEPVKTEEGWAVIRLEKKDDRVGHTLYDENHKTKMRDYMIGVRQKEINEILEDSLRKARNYTFNEDNAHTVMEALKSISKRQDPLKILTEKEQNLTIASIDNGKTTLNAISIVKSQKSNRGLSNILKSKVVMRRYCKRNITADIIIPDHVKKLGYYERSECLDFAQIVIDMEVQKLANKMMVLDKVNPSEADAKKYFKANPANYMTDPEYIIVEILVSDKRKADDLVKRINNGELMTNLAEHHSERPSVDIHKGIIGPMSLAKLGEIGEIAANAKAGELLGPFYLKGYGKWTIFKILSTIDPKPLEFTNDVKKQVIKDLKIKLQAELEKAWIEELRQNINYTINPGLLNNLFTDVKPTENPAI
ncbi:MAG: peptidylprolyl isomerase [Candidatus Electryonea clarkiae]|nr:peptidylprolyl isomerase [Candidatus Electryonea clarkiae]MDP8285583.1 peptidylprolyl isomerase [Candidatus Electryonea clarkiae]